MPNLRSTMRSVPFVLQAAVLTLACVIFGTAAPAQLEHANTGDTRVGDEFSSNAAGAVEVARKLVAAGDLDGAVRGLRTYVAAHPNELAPARYLGDLYYRTPNLAAAERTYRAILRFAPADRETHNRLGGIYAAEDRVVDAVAEFQQSLPSSSAYGHLVELHRRLGDLDRFEALYRRAAESAPSDAGAQYALGTVYRAEHRTQLAVPQLERALMLAPHSCPTLAELGSAYLDVDRTGDAIAVLQRCLAFEPSDYAALVNLGDAYIAQRRYAAARTPLERAAQGRPDGPEALVDIGYLEDTAQRWQSAVSYYLRAIAADPLIRDAYVDLGYDYGEHRLYALAEAAFLKGLSIAPGDGRLHYLLGVTYSAQGKRELARAEYRRATGSDEPDVARAASRDLTSLQ